MPEVDICTKCGKEKRPRVSGSFTQWLLDQRYCDCGRIAKDIVVETEVEYCPSCKKPKESGRPGSMTQWIFRASTCSCLCNPELISALQSAETDGTAGTEKIGEEQIDEVYEAEELALDPRQFPVDRYKALRELGRGGSGNVYLCQDRMLGINVAVKTLRKLDSEQLIAFQTEARATSRLTHPTILRLLDFGPTDSGSPYLVMEYFDGISLHDWMETNGLPDITTTISIFEKIASGLKKAHAEGIFHRDLKPTNILISKKQPLEIKLIDFGIATIGHEESSTTVQGKTIVGTPAYMPPDTVRGGLYDVRSEIYNVGCVLYECLTGAPPFQSESALEVMRMHAESPPPPLIGQGTRPIPQALELLVRKCLEKNPAARFTSMDELTEALSGILDSSVSNEKEEAVAQPQTVLTNNAKWLIPVSVVVVVSVALSIFVIPLMSPTREIKRPFKDSIQAKKRKRQNSESGISDLNPAAMADSLALAASDFQTLTAAAQKGDVKAQAKLGYMYRNGENVPRDDHEAFKWMSKAAEGGDDDAQTTLGFIYKDGVGVKQDYSKATFWFKRAASKNNHHALNAMGQMHHFGLGTKVNSVEAARYFRKAMNLGYSTAKNNLANLYELGEIGNGPDYAKAMELYKEATEEGNEMSPNNIGYMYMQGRGVKQDYGEAVKWLNIAAERGCLLAHINLSELYEKGLGVAQSDKEAIRHLTIAADGGHSTALNNLAHYYMSGKAGPQRVADAIPLFKKAIEQKNYSAMSNLGLMYEEGHGCKPDLAEATRLYMVAAKNGDLYANNNLGNLYKRGVGVQRDYKKAVQHYLFSAERGNDTAEYNLGLMYLDGYGVKKNIAKAISYFTSAASKGNAEANEHLGHLYATGSGIKRDYKKALQYTLAAANAGRPGAQYDLARIFDEGLGHPKNQRVARYWYQRAANGGSSQAQERLRALDNIKRVNGLVE